jgi:hypothetical protein
VSVGPAFQFGIARFIVSRDFCETKTSNQRIVLACRATG